MSIFFLSRFCLLFKASYVEVLQPYVRCFCLIHSTIRLHCLSPRKSPLCTMTGFRPFTVSLILDYFFPFIILHIAAGLHLDYVQLYFKSDTDNLLP